MLKIEKKSFVEIARVLARRTPEMVAAMYARHRNVLQNEAIDKKMFLAAALDLQNNLVQAVDVQEVHNSSIVEARISSANNSIGMNTNKVNSIPS